MNIIKEDIPINNNASSGEVAGLDNNPPVERNKKNRLLSKKPLRRILSDVR